MSSATRRADPQAGAEAAAPTQAPSSLAAPPHGKRRAEAKLDLVGFGDRRELPIIIRAPLLEESWHRIASPWCAGSVPTGCGRARTGPGGMRGAAAPHSLLAGSDPGCTCQPAAPSDSSHSAPGSGDRVWGKPASGTWLVFRPLQTCCPGAKGQICHVGLLFPAILRCRLRKFSGKAFPGRGAAQ